MQKFDLSYLEWEQARSLLFRFLIACTIGFISGWLAANPNFLLTGPGGDFVGWGVRAARDLLNGRDPYDYPFHVMAVSYPLPAAFVGMPFAYFDDGLAGGLFIGISSAILAFGMTRGSKYWRLMAFLSYPYIEVIRDVQWAVLLMNISIYSDLLPLVLIKPHIGIAAAVMHKPKKRGLVLTVIVFLISLIIYPLWPFRWILQIRPYEGYIPFLFPGGMFLLLSIIRWRHPNGRLLLFMSIFPKRAFYDNFLLMLIPEHWSEMLLLTVISWIAVELYALISWPATLILYFLSLIFVLRPESWLRRKQA